MPETGFEILPAILMTSGQAETGILCGQLTGRVAEISLFEGPAKKFSEFS